MDIHETKNNQSLIHCSFIYLNYSFLLSRLAWELLNHFVSSHFPFHLSLAAIGPMFHKPTNVAQTTTLVFLPNSMPPHCVSPTYSYFIQSVICWSGVRDGPWSISHPTLFIIILVFGRTPGSKNSRK